MFNLGAGEVLVILLLALIVLGPQRLPDAAKQVGKFMGEMRRLSSGFQNELKTAFDDESEAAARKRGAAVARPAEVAAAAEATAGSAAASAEVVPSDAKPFTPPSTLTGAKKKAAPRKAAAKKAAPRKAAAKKAGAAKATRKATPAPTRRAR